MKTINRIYTKYFYVVVWLVLMFGLASCSKDTVNSPVEPTLTARGQLIGFSTNGTYKVQQLQEYLDSYGVGSQYNITLKYDVNIYKIVYSTIDPEGNIIKVSGAIFVPKGQNNLPLISLQHGTQTNRNSVASVAPLVSPDGFVAASLGYYAVVPDYIGLGDSQVLHPYHYEKSSADAVVDLIIAGREYAKQNSIDLNGRVFLAGYSEGGYVTLAAQKEIEQNYSNEIELTACAPMAGAYDLNLTAQSILQNRTYNEPSFLAFLIYAYNEIYGWNRLGDFFNSPYAERIPGLFDGTKSISQIDASLTTDLTLLFKQNFVQNYLAGNETAVSTALEENSLISWVPKTPIRFYHGNADEYVPYQNSVEAKNYFQAHGADVELVTIEGGTHESSAIPSILDAVEWFESLKLSKKMLAVVR